MEVLNLISHWPVVSLNPFFWDWSPWQFLGLECGHCQLPLALWSESLCDQHTLGIVPGGWYYIYNSECMYFQITDTSTPKRFGMCVSCHHNCWFQKHMFLLWFREQEDDQKPQCSTFCSPPHPTPGRSINEILIIENRISEKQFFAYLSFLYKQLEPRD